MNATTTNRTGRAGAFAAVAIFALAGAVVAQDAFDRPLGEPRERPNREPARQIDRQAYSFMNFSTTVGDRRVEVEVRNGEVSARINGEEVPEDQIRRDGDRLEILDERGNVVSTFRIPAPRFEVRPLPQRGGREEGLRPGQPLIVPPRGLGDPRADIAPPPVMIGITMSEVPRTLTEHLELEPDSGVMIDSVVEGLPAAMAGLRPRDIIIEFDGVRPVTMKMLRETLNDKTAGEQIEVKVIRRGQEKTINVELVAFEQEKLAPAIRDEAREHGAADALRDDEFRDFFEEPGRHPGLGDFDADQWQRLGELFRDRPMGRPPQGAWPEHFEFFVPMAPRDQRGMADKITKLDERMADLERQMEHLAERLRELNEAIARDQKQERD